MFHVKHEGWPSALDLDEAQILKLATYEDLIREKSPQLGLISATDLPRLHDRHILDCLRGSAGLRPEDRSVLDIGSGAGLPGLVLAIARPSLTFTLVEARLKRAAFIELALSRLEVGNASVHAGRIEEFVSLSDVCLTRALANAARSWRLAEPHLSERGRLLYWGGDSFTLSDTPEGVRAAIVGKPALERFGPLVMMCRQ